MSTSDPALLVPDRNRSQPLWQLIWRAVRLRCPSCGRGKLFRGWFAMHAHCGECDRPFSGDEGYFLGSIYFNYGVTGVLVVVIYFTMYFGDILSNDQRLAVLSVFVVLFPVWFFRYARALWIAFDEYWDPWRKSGDDFRTLSVGD